MRSKRFIIIQSLHFHHPQAYQNHTGLRLNPRDYSYKSLWHLLQGNTELCMMESIDGRYFKINLELCPSYCLEGHFLVFLSGGTSPVILAALFSLLLGTGSYFKSCAFFVPFFYLDNTKSTEGLLLLAGTKPTPPPNQLLPSTRSVTQQQVGFNTTTSRLPGPQNLDDKHK